MTGGLILLSHHFAIYLQPETAQNFIKYSIRQLTQENKIEQVFNLHEIEKNNL
ncbi:hypothetical protein DDM35_003934 [Escherichia coli]|nr:hypothetical protein [Escherichia coli]